MTSQHGEFNSIISAFEFAWQSGERPSLSDFILRVAESGRDALAIQLIPIDIEYRTKLSERVTAADYISFGQKLQPAVEEWIASRMSPGRLSTDTTQTLNHPSSSQSRVIGNFKLLQKLGEGGMGTVWMAEQERPVRRRVALKLIKAGHDSKEVVARFEAERQALAMMDHQNIAKVLDGGTTDNGQPYFVMELVQGIPFNKYCDQHKLSINERLELFVPICNAVQHAHQKGIIHRDLKPSNILVSLYDGKPVPKVIDFGLAKALQHQAKLTDKTLFTEFGQVVGTLQYMSPEQAEMNQLDVDTRTDVYSLGVILYELLTGSTPIEAETLKKQAVLKVLESIRELEPPRPSARLSSSSNDAVSGISKQRQIDPGKLRSILRGELDWIVMKALEKDRSRRYETANGFSSDICRFLKGEVVLARPPSIGYRTKKFVRNNWTMVTALSLTMLALLIGIALAGWFGVAARVASNNAIRARDDADTNSKIANAERLRALAAVAELERTNARSSFSLAANLWQSARAYDSRKSLAAVPARFRDSAWWFLNNQLEGSQWTGFGHKGSVNTCKYDHARSRILTAGSDSKIRIWDPKSGKLLSTTPHPAEIVKIGIDPTADRCVILQANRVVKIAELESLAIIREIKGESPISCIAISGGKLVCGCVSGQVLVFDVQSGKSLRVLSAPDGTVSSVCLSSTGRSMISGHENGNICVWNLDGSSDSPTSRNRLHLGNVNDVTFSPDDNTIASAGEDRSIALWSVQSDSLLATLEGHVLQPVKCVKFSPDSRTLVSGSSDATIRCWDVAKKKLLHTWSGHVHTIRDLDFSEDGTCIVSVSDDGLVKHWSAMSPLKSTSLVGHMGRADPVEWSADGENIACAGFNGEVKLWDVAKQKMLWSGRMDGDRVNSLSFTSDSRCLATGGQDSTVRIWDTKTGTLLFQSSIFDSPVRAVKFANSGNLLALGCEDGTLHVLESNFEKGSKPQSKLLLRLHTKAVNCLAFNTQGNRLAIGGLDGRITIYDLSQSKVVSRHTVASAVSKVAYHPTRERIAAALGDGNIQVIDLEDNSRSQSLVGHSMWVQDVSFHPEGSILCSGSEDHSLRFWDLQSGAELLKVNIGTLVFGAKFDDEGQRIAVGLHANGTRSQNLNAIFECPKSTDNVYVFCTSPVQKAGFLSDKHHFSVQSTNGTWMHWNSQTGESLQDLPTPDLQAKVSPQSTDKRYAFHRVNTREPGHLFVVIDQYQQAAHQETLAARSPESSLRNWHESIRQEALKDRNWFAEAFHRKLVDSIKVELLQPNGLIDVVSTPDEHSPLKGHSDIPWLKPADIYRSRFIEGWGAAWSPDSNKIVRNSRFSGENGKLEIVDLLSGITTQLSPDGVDPAWSPVEGGPIAFARAPDGQKRSSQNESVWLIEPDGTNLRRFCDGGFPTCDSHGKLFVRRIESGELRFDRFTLGTSNGVLQSEVVSSLYPSASADGRMVAYCQGRAILVIDTSAQEVVASFTHPTLEGAVCAFSPDNRFVCFGSYLSASPGLWMLELATERCRLLSDEFLTRPAWSPDGKCIAVDDRRNNRILLLDTDELAMFSNWETSTEIRSLKLANQRNSHAEVAQPARLKCIEALHNALANVRKAYSNANAPEQFVSAIKELFKLGLVAQAKQLAQTAIDRHKNHEELALVINQLESAKPTTGEIWVIGTFGSRLQVELFRHRVEERNRARTGPSGETTYEKYSVKVPVPSNLEPTLVESFKALKTLASELAIPLLIVEDVRHATNGAVWNFCLKQIQSEDRFGLDKIENFDLLIEAYQARPKGVSANTLALGSLCMGHFAEAAKYAEYSLEHTPVELNLGEPHPIDFAILALAHRELKLTETSLAFLDKFRQSVRGDKFRNDAECTIIARVVDTIFSK